MSATLIADIGDRADRTELAVRLAALDQITQIGAARTGPDGFREELIAEATDVLSRAGQRLRLSSHHTVVSLAGGTGSGKSSLFNRLSGADFSTVGVTRPVTREAHACVWGMAGAGPLLEWLGVPRQHRYARASALGGGEQSMTGLVLLDLPDHDSVLGHATDQVDKLVGLSDVMIWVLDPQKYADFAVHTRFLVPLAGHSEVVAVVLNQCDLLTPGQIEDCVQDLRRLLDSESLQDAQILVTSAKTGEGIEELRKLLIEAVTARRAAAARIVADVDKVVAGFEPYGERMPAGDPDDPPGAEGLQADEELPEGTDRELAAALAEAAGVHAIGDSLRSARELRAADYVGWPVSWLLERFTSPNPARKVRLGRLWEQLRDVTTGPSGAQQADIDNALTWVANSRLPELRQPWSRTVRAALRSGAGEIPGAIGAEIADALPAGPVVDRWWRLLGILQGLLLGCVLVGFAWLVALLVIGVGKVGSGVPKLFSDPWLLPWPAVLIVAGLVGGWLSERLGTKAVREAAERETEVLVDDIYRRLTAVAHDLIVLPAEDELAELRLYRRELRVAAGD
ncbi:MAG TPA: ABC transporter [Streptosporangiaceae bacterium]|nr:ABC transporter [Streptosporangiaceae bacterium]